MISRLMRALRENLETRKSCESGDKYSFPLQQSNKSVETSLHAIIDARIELFLKRNKPRQSSTISLTPVKNEFDPESIQYISALNSCPTPPIIPENMPVDQMRVWFSTYSNWYNDIRNKALGK